MLRWIKNIRQVFYTERVAVFCDRAIIFAVCVMILFLPVSIALLESFAGVAIFFYLLKKINSMARHWSQEFSSLSLLMKFHCLRIGFAPVSNVLNRPLALLTGAIFISVLLSQYPKLSVVAFIGKFLKVVFVYFSFIEVFNTKERIRVFLGFFGVSALVTILSGFFQYETGKDFLKGHLLLGGRINASFYTANGLGAYLLPVIGLLVNGVYAFFVDHKSWILKITSGVFLGLALICLCGTYSRSAWIGYVVILAVTAVLDRRKVLWSLFLALFLIFMYLPSLNHVRHLHLINDMSDQELQKKASLPVIQQSPVESVKSILAQGGSGRLGFWKQALGIIYSSPIYGTGLNTYARIIKRDPDIQKHWYAHNCYLQLTAECGIIGLVCFLGLIFVLLKHGIARCGWIKDLESRSVLQGTIAGLSGFWIQSFLDNTFFTVQLSVLMWLLFGLWVALTRLETDTCELKK